MKTLEGKLVSDGMKVGIVAARFNEFITSKLVSGAMDGLTRHGINTVEDLVSKSEDEMMKVRNLGRKSLEEVMAKLDSLGFKLNTDDE